MTDTTLAPFLALHVLQAIPASLLNRDDAGSIKKITVDGVPRVRVSSQSWKRAIRIGLRTAAIDGGSFGLRTTRFPKLTAEALAGNHGVDPHRAAAVSAAVFTGLGLKANEKTGNTSVAVFASEELPTRVAAALAEHDADIVFDEKKGVVIPDPVLAAARAALDVDATIDLALFGRMLAEIPGGNVDGAVSVAHAFSVDPLALEADFFTAVDDAAGEGEAVSSMLDTADLAAPTLYRYVELDRRQLRTNLAAASTDPAVIEELALAAEAALIEWTVRSLPASKKRSSAAHTLPILVLADTGTAVYSLADAFSPAIRGDQVAAEAAARLLRHSAAARPFTGGTTAALAINPTIADHLDLTGIDATTTLGDLITQVRR
ncbi:type I-E CRISPR-associated protein Cas7/Cse4/CasC [Rhodococcus hoagii]|nr:type I-E CRISPR-associated protein Cas7/Cse4/CasC [Prescottella equi]MBM4654114.1 type I-E CRISPR-associated protein Cas7/Cse4/CasC [Prescottella equi]MBM4719588.1 type I-E CRISPR-associated protein Cas7/Cse4/CasC [Prescottella equi]NKT56002.1 type I-E CRISPR-associated protein Cas7/Cse4/CasC [Prescottella equi]NKU37374.1 type I-E CRISPR-associated protein Cas7/Cse4/CasC [Prescottella equi]